MLMIKFGMLKKLLLLYNCPSSQTPPNCSFGTWEMWFSRLVYEKQ